MSARFSLNDTSILKNQGAFMKNLAAAAVNPTRKENLMEEYRVGDKDVRPWGNYAVTDVGRGKNDEEFCEKIITVHPGRMLSLQSHTLRRETWTVEEGVLTVLLDGKRIEVPAGEAVHIPRGSLHCMANLGQADCVVRERQEGMCRESDIRRYVDAYGRAMEKSRSPRVRESIRAYEEILAEIKKKEESRKAG